MRATTLRYMVMFQTKLPWGRRQLEIKLVSVIVPVYNEKEAIADDVAVIRETMDASRWDYEVIVVDDASTDGTAEILKGIDGIKVLTHEENRGGGFSRNTGIKACSGDVFVVTDGDGTYPNRVIPEMLEEMESRDLDMIVGARVKESGTMKVLRGPAKLFIRKLATAMSGFKIKDLNSGLRALRKDVFMQFMEILPWGHSWVSTITLAMLSSGYAVAYFDIDYYPRKGTSTFHPVKDTYAYLTLVIRTVTWFNPLKVFIPTALVIFLIGLGKFAFDNYEHFWRMTPATVMLILVAVQIAMLGLLADLIVKRRR
jgi:glycosyltransferase involved in cell wall biosynthesis